MRGLAIALLLAGCTVTPPEGQLVCTTDEQCPPTWSCVLERCYAQPFDGGLDAPPVDAGIDAGHDAAPDAGADAAPPDAPTDAPPDGGPLEELVAIAAGDQHTCALTSEGAVWCWGANADGQLGNDTTTRQTSAVLVGTVPPSTAICAGNAHTCARTRLGEIWCWGSNARGQVGAADMGASYDEPVMVVGDATLLTCGGAHTCAVIGGELWCWGEGSAGQIGDDTYMTRMMPVRVAMPPATITRISAGGSHTCALDAAGAAYCWGYNSNGQLGDMETATGLFGSRPRPAQVDTSIALLEIEAGTSHTCAITIDGDALCWGNNANRQLGEMGMDRVVPTAVIPLAGADVDEIVGGTSHTCALIADEPWCWGRNHRGQIGNDMTMPFADVAPIEVVFVFGAPVLHVAAGGAHSCAIQARRALCWGENTMGQLGNSSTTDADAPVEVDDLVLSP